MITLFRAITSFGARGLKVLAAVGIGKLLRELVTLIVKFIVELAKIHVWKWIFRLMVRFGGWIVLAGLTLVLALLALAAGMLS